MTTDIGSFFIIYVVYIIPKYLYKTDTDIQKTRIQKEYGSLAADRGIEPLIPP